MENNLIPVETNNQHRRPGRPPKKDFNPIDQMRELVNIAAEIYHKTREIKATAMELSLPPNKVKKLLITGKVLSYPETEYIRALMKSGKTMEEIQRILGLSYSALHTYLPYTKVVYKMAQISQNAERIKRYKIRKQAVENLKDDCIEDNLYQCVLAFQEYPFHTSSGLPFSYQMKVGRNGEYTKELFIDRRTNSKSLAWSSVRIAFEKALVKRDRVINGPKEIADVRGISYIYSLLWRFEVIRVPKEIEEKLRGKHTR